MHIVAGLGNPGPEYRDNRHNTGFMVLEVVARRAGVDLGTQRYRGRFARASVAGEPVALLQPQTYMNLCGESVGEAARFFKVEPEDIVVVHDELDLPFGEVRVKKGGGLAGHNGLKSIAQHLGSREFLRIRVGIGRPAQGVVGHVLNDFSPEETEHLDAALGRAADALEVLIREGPRIAMNRFNVKPKKPKKEEAEPADPEDGPNS